MNFDKNIDYIFDLSYEDESFINLKSSTLYDIYKRLLEIDNKVSNLISDFNYFIKYNRE